MRWSDPIRSSSPHALLLALIGCITIACSQQLPAQVGWSPANNGLPSDSIQIIAIAADSLGYIYLLTPSGPITSHSGSPRYSALFRSTDNGGSWELVADQLNADPPVIDANNGIFLSRLTFRSYPGYDVQQSYIIHSTDHGTSWRTLTKGRATTIGWNNSGVVVLGYQFVEYLDSFGAGIRISSDGGVNWKDTLLEYGIADSRLTVSAVAPDGTVLYGYRGSAGLDTSGHRTGLYRSGDLGGSWTRVSREYPMQALAAGQDGTFLAAYPLEHPSTAYGIFRSTDRGERWTMTYQTSYASRFIFNSQGNIFFPNNPLLRSVDGGVSWERLGVAIDELYPGSGDELFALIDSTPHRSIDNGTTWEQIANGLPERSTHELAVSSNGYLFAATAHNGVYRGARSSVAAGPERGSRTSPSFEGIRPHPAVDDVTISFGPATGGDALLEVYDLLGRHVRTLFEGSIATGTDHIDLDVRGIEPGIYLLRMTAEGRSISRGFVIER